MKIIGLKLINGQDIIGRVVEEKDTVFVLQQIRSLIAQPGSQGVQIAMPPWSFLSIDAEFEIPVSSVCGAVETLGGEIERAYIQSTSSLDLSGIS